MTEPKILIHFDETRLHQVVLDAVRVALLSERASYLNKKEAAAFLKVSPVTLWKWQKNKKLLPVVTDAGREMYLRSDLDRFAAGQRLGQ
jgi:hypothetical protein